MSETWATFLFQAANFLLLAAVLGWLFFRPVRDALESRRSALEDERRAAADARAEADRVLAEAHARRRELEDSLDGLRERVRAEAEAERERILEAARAQTRRERDGVKEDLVSLRRAQAHALARDAALAARQIVVGLLENMEGPDLEASLLRAAARELHSLRASGPLAPVVIESARPLAEEGACALASAAAVAPEETTRRVDDGLVAGVRVVTARGLVDASAAGLASQAERVLLGQLGQESLEHG